MEIQTDPHALERAEERGTSAEEIRDVLNTGSPLRAKYGRTGKAKVFEFNHERHGRYYEHKRVEVFYTVERGVFVTVTVYVFYGKWEGEDANSLRH